MTKYINNFSSVSAATEATGLLSPNVTYVHEGEGEKILVLDCGDDAEVKITGSSIADLEIKKKQQEKPIIKPTTGNKYFYFGIDLSNYTSKLKDMMWATLSYETNDCIYRPYNLYQYSGGDLGEYLTNNETGSPLFGPVLGYAVDTQNRGKFYCIIYGYDETTEQDVIIGKTEELDLNDASAYISETMSGISSPYTFTTLN